MFKRKKLMRQAKKNNLQNQMTNFYCTKYGSEDM